MGPMSYGANIADAGRKLQLARHHLLRVRGVAAEIAVAQVDEELGILGADAGRSPREEADSLIFGRSPGDSTVPTTELNWCAKRTIYAAQTIAGEPRMVSVAIHAPHSKNRTNWNTWFTEAGVFQRRRS
jgi:hypothetical protein